MDDHVSTENNLPPVPTPSVFMHSFVGYLIATALGISAVVVMSINAGDFDEQAAFQILVCAGTIGAMIGFKIAARRLKAFGGGGMAAEWKLFWGSFLFYGLAPIILGGSAVITLLGSLIAFAVVVPATPKKAMIEAPLQASTACQSQRSRLPLLR